MSAKFTSIVKMTEKIVFRAEEDAGGGFFSKIRQRPSVDIILDVLDSMHGFARRVLYYYDSLVLFLGAGFTRDNVQRTRTLSRFSVARAAGFRKPKDGRQRDSSFPIITGHEALVAVGREHYSTSSGGAHSFDSSPPWLFGGRRRKWSAAASVSGVADDDGGVSPDFVGDEAAAPDADGALELEEVGVAAGGGGADAEDAAAEDEEEEEEEDEQAGSYVVLGGAA